MDQNWLEFIGVVSLLFVLCSRIFKSYKYAFGYESSAWLNVGCCIFANWNYKHEDQWLAHWCGFHTKLTLKTQVFYVSFFASNFNCFCLKSQVQLVSLALGGFYALCSIEFMSLHNDSNHGNEIWLFSSSSSFSSPWMELFIQWCVPCGPSLRRITTVGSTPSHGKKAIEINLTLPEETSMKKS